MPSLQIPPAVGSSGQFVETVIVTSSQNRHVMVIGDGVSSATGPVTTSGGQLVTVNNPTTAITFTNAATTQVNTLSSGPILISGTVTVVSASSGLVQVSGTPLVNLVGTSSGVAVVTTSGGLNISITNPTTAVTITNTIRSLSSGTVTLSSNPTIISASSGFVQALFPINSSAGFGPVTSSAGILASLSSGTIIMSSVQSVTATAATNPWSSAPGFNMPILSASSGLVQISGTPLVNLVGTSSGVAVVTTSGGLSVHITDNSAPVTSSYGVLVNVLSTLQATAPIVISLLTTIGKISSSPSVLHWMYAVQSCSTGVATSYLRIYDATTSSVVVGTSVKLILPLTVSSYAVLSITSSQGAVTPAQLMPSAVWPPGMNFTSGISVDCVLVTTSTAVTSASNIFITAIVL